jgi:RNA polymerase sigma-70 factor, ECF subfamily
MGPLESTPQSRPNTLQLEPGLSFEAVHARYAPVVHGMLLGRVPRSDVEDLVQEVFLRVHAGMHELRDLASLPAWISRITRNLAADFLRRRAVAPRDEQLTDIAHESPSAVNDRDISGQVLAHVQALPEAYRDSLILRLVEGLSGPEIAARTGLTPGSVRVNLSRGMALLRPRLLKAGVLS